MKVFKKHKQLILTILFIILAFLLFGVHVFNKNIWYDEAYQMVLNNYSFKDITYFVKNDTSPPLYAYIIKFFTTIFSHDKLVVARLVSFALFSIQFVIAFYPIKRLFGIKTSIIYSCLILTSYAGFYSSIEVRLYGMSMMATLGAITYSLLYLKEKKKSDLVKYIIFGTLSVYGHNYAMFAIFFLQIITTIYALIKKNGRKIILGNVLIFIFYIPWLLILFKQASAVSSSFWIQKPTIDTFVNSIHQLINSNTIICYIYLVLLIIAIIFSKTRKKTVIESLYIILPAVLSLGSFILFSYLKQPLYLTRYVVPVCGLIYLSVSVILANNKYIIYTIIFLLLSIPYAVDLYNLEELNNDDKATTDMIDFINENVPGKKSFFTMTEANLGLASYYFPNSNYYVEESTYIIVNKPEIFGNVIFSSDLEDEKIILLITDQSSNIYMYLNILKKYDVVNYFKGSCLYNGGYEVYILERKSNQRVC